MSSRFSDFRRGNAGDSLVMIVSSFTCDDRGNVSDSLVVINAGDSVVVFVSWLVVIDAADSLMA